MRSSTLISKRILSCQRLYEFLATYDTTKLHKPLQFPSLFAEKIKNVYSNFAVQINFGFPPIGQMLPLTFCCFVYFAPTPTLQTYNAEWLPYSTRLQVLTCIQQSFLTSFSADFLKPQVFGHPPCTIDMKPSQFIL